MTLHKITYRSAQIEVDQLWCPRCGTKLRWSLVPADTVPDNTASSEITEAVESGDDILMLDAIEKRTILAAMQKAGGDKIRAARLLGIGKTTIYRKLKEYGLDARSTFSVGWHSEFSGAQDHPEPDALTGQQESAVTEHRVPRAHS